MQKSNGIMCNNNSPLLMINNQFSLTQRQQGETMSIETTRRDSTVAPSYHRRMPYTCVAAYARGLAAMHL